MTDIGAKADGLAGFYAPTLQLVQHAGFTQNVTQSLDGVRVSKIGALGKALNLLAADYKASVGFDHVPGFIGVWQTQDRELGLGTLFSGFGIGLLHSFDQAVEQLFNPGFAFGRN